MLTVRVSAILAILTLAIACGGGDDDAPGPTGSRSADDAVCDVKVSDPGDAYSRLRPSVVFVSVSRSGGAGVGTGFILAEDEVITNAHVVAGAEEIRIEFNGGDVIDADTSLVRVDEDRDVALIPIETGDAPPASLGNSSTISSGQRLIAVGYPVLPDESFPQPGSAGEPSVSDGIFSASKQLDAQPWLITTVPINPGNSGGPMADLCGVVYGVSTGHYPDSENISIAIPIDEVDRFQDLVHDGGGDPIPGEDTPDGELPVIAKALRAANLDLADLPAGFVVDDEQFTNGGGLPGDPLEACGEALGLFSSFNNEGSISASSGMSYVQSGVFSFIDNQEASDCFAAGSALFTDEEFIGALLQESEGSDYQIVADEISLLEPTDLFDEETPLHVTGRYLFDDGTELPFENFTWGFRDGKQIALLSVYSLPTTDFDAVADLAATLAFKMEEVFGE